MVVFSVSCLIQYDISLGVYTNLNKLVLPVLAKSIITLSERKLLLMITLKITSSDSLAIKIGKTLYESCFAAINVAELPSLFFIFLCLSMTSYKHYIALYYAHIMRHESF